MSTSDIIRENVKRLLKETKQTQAKLAEFLNVSMVHVSDLLAGKRGKDLKISFIEGMAKFFNVSITELMKTEEVHVPKIDPELEEMIDTLSDLWGHSTEREKGVILMVFRQILIQYESMLPPSLKNMKIA